MVYITTPAILSYLLCESFSDPYSMTLMCRKVRSSNGNDGPTSDACTLHLGQFPSLSYS